jgi:hypothetical protein
MITEIVLNTKPTDQVKLETLTEKEIDGKVVFFMSKNYSFKFLRTILFNNKEMWSFRGISVDESITHFVADSKGECIHQALSEGRQVFMLDEDEFDKLLKTLITP